MFRIGKPYVRDVHYDFATLVENFLDPAHVPFAHHGVQGNRCGRTQLGLCESEVDGRPVEGHTGSNCSCGMEHTSLF